MLRSTLRAVAPALLGILGACTGNASNDRQANQLPKECEAFVSSYRECFTAGKGDSQLARGREQQTRAALVEALLREGPAELVAKCQGNLERMTSACEESRAADANPTELAPPIFGGAR
jgi:hypothetical protein